MEVVSDVINCEQALPFLTIRPQDHSQSLSVHVELTNTLAGLFILEPPLALLAFDLAYFSPRHHVLHLFDTFVVIVSFALIFVRPERSATTGTNGKEGQGSLASLVVVLRMWRLVKVVDEVAMGGEEMGEEARAEKQQRPQRKYGQVDALPPSEKRRRAAADSDSDASEP